MDSKTVIMLLGPWDLGGPESYSAGADIERCHRLIERFGQLLIRALDTPTELRIAYSEEIEVWKITLRVSLRGSYRLYRYSTAYAEYYDKLVLARGRVSEAERSNYATLALLLRRIADEFKTPQMRLMRPGEIDVLAA